MRKGITPIIAVIILLLITVALAGLAWTFLSGYFSGMTAQNIQLIDYSCSGGTARVIFRNAGTASISAALTCTLDGTNTVATCGTGLTVVKTQGTYSADPTVSTATIAAGTTATFTDNCGASTTCTYRLTTTTGAAGPSPNVATVNC